MTVASIAPLPPRVSRAARLAQELEATIRVDAREPGERIATKQELRERFGVAAATINEAVRLLETRGVVEARPGPGGGIFVARAAVRSAIRFAHVHTVLGFPNERTTFRDCLLVRDALEPLICRDAARVRSGPDVAALQALVALMERHVEDAGAYFKCNWQLHRRIAALTQNMPLRSIYLTLTEGLESMLDDSVIDEFDGAANVAIHRELVEAIASGPGARLEAAIAAHTPLGPELS
ncbi:MAG TPA: FCD domain-containing protein [Solirubrobacteraceae bacterium]|nr:FCD domain-containing protein [Solirubrobacteraceae bacterium]